MIWARNSWGESRAGSCYSSVADTSYSCSGGADLTNDMPEVLKTNGLKTGSAENVCGVKLAQDRRFGMLLMIQSRIVCGLLHLSTLCPSMLQPGDVPVLVTRE